MKCLKEKVCRPFYWQGAFWKVQTSFDTSNLWKFFKAARMMLTKQDSSKFILWSL